MREAYSY